MGEIAELMFIQAFIPKTAVTIIDTSHYLMGRWWMARTSKFQSRQRGSLLHERWRSSRLMSGKCLHCWSEKNNIATNQIWLINNFYKQAIQRVENWHAGIRQDYFKANPSKNLHDVKVNSYWFRVTKDTKTGQVSNAFITLPSRNSKW